MATVNIGADNGTVAPSRASRADSMTRELPPASPRLVGSDPSPPLHEQPATRSTATRCPDQAKIEGRKQRIDHAGMQDVARPARPPPT